MGGGEFGLSDIGEGGRRNLQLKVLAESARTKSVEETKEFRQHFQK